MSWTLFIQVMLLVALVSLVVLLAISLILDKSKKATDG